MQKLEYISFKCDIIKELDAELNARGAECWVFVHAVLIQGNFGLVVMCRTIDGQSNNPLFGGN